MRPAAGAALLAGLLAAFGAGAITKCVDKAGKVSYQDGKCPDESRQDTLDIRVPPPASSFVPGAGPPPKPKDAQFNAAEDTITAYEACAAQDIEFARRHVAEFESWKKANQRLYLRVRRDNDAPDRIKEEVSKATAAWRGFTPEQAKARMDFCDASVPALLGRDVEKSFPPPPKRD